MLDKGAEIIRQAKEERKNTKMDKTRIIVVEDNIVYCEFVCNLLAREGFRTVQAYHLSTAKKLLQQASTGTSWFLTYDYPTVTASTYYDGCARKA